MKVIVRIEQLGSPLSSDIYIPVQLCVNTNSSMALADQINVLAASYCVRGQETREYLVNTKLLIKIC